MQGHSLIPNKFESSLSYSSVWLKKKKKCYLLPFILKMGEFFLKSCYRCLPAGRLCAAWKGALCHQTSTEYIDWAQKGKKIERVQQSLILHRRGDQGTVTPT